MAESKLIWVSPQAGQKFRHHHTKVLHDGPFQADPQDLDIVRSLSWGALIESEAPLELAPEAVDGEQQQTGEATGRRRKSVTVPLGDGQVP